MQGVGGSRMPSVGESRVKAKPSSKQSQESHLLRWVHIKAHKIEGCFVTRLFDQKLLNTNTYKATAANEKNGVSFGGEVLADDSLVHILLIYDCTPPPPGSPQPIASWRSGFHIAILRGSTQHVY